MYSSNRFFKYMKQKMIELKREIDKFTFIVEDFNTSLPEINCICKP